MLGELVEEGVVTFVRGPDGHVVAPDDAALRGLPEEFGVWMFGEFIEADITAVDGHRLRVCGEGDDARAVVEFDVADFDFLSNRTARGATRTGQNARPTGATRTGRPTRTGHLEIIFAVGDDGAGEVENVDEFFGDAHVFEGAGVVFGSKEVIAVGEFETFADVFESIGVGPTDAHRFFREGKGLFPGGVEFVLGQNPGHLVREEAFVEGSVGVNGDEWEDGGHTNSLHGYMGYISYMRVIGFNPRRIF